MKFNKDYIIHNKQKTVREIFADLIQYGVFHPLINRVTVLEQLEQSTTYLISEQPYNYIPINIKYSANKIEVNDSIVYTISGIPLLKPKIIYRFDTVEEDQTTVNFELSIHGVPILKKILLNKMVDAQDQLMESINMKLLN